METKPIVYLFEDREEVANAAIAVLSGHFELTHIREADAFPAAFAAGSLILLGETSQAHIADISMNAENCPIIRISAEGTTTLIRISAEGTNTLTQSIPAPYFAKVKPDFVLQTVETDAHPLLKFLFLAKWMAKLYGEEKPLPFSDEILERIKGKRVLIADDEPSICAIMAACVESLGCFAETSENGKEGLQKFKEAKERGKPFDLVITDLYMPEMNGIELAAEIKKLTPAAGIIAITAFTVRKFDSSLFKTMLHKPLDLLDICGCAGAVLARQELSKKRVLLVDDQEVLGILKKILELEGYSVSAFSKPLDALSAVKNSAVFDLAVIGHDDTCQKATAGLLDGLQKAGAKFPIIHLVQQDDLQEFPYILKKPLSTSMCLSNMVQQILAAQKPDGTKANVAARKMRAAGLPEGAQHKQSFPAGAKTPMQKR